MPGLNTIADFNPQQHASPLDIQHYVNWARQQQSLRSAQQANTASHLSGLSGFLGMLATPMDAPLGIGQLMQALQGNGFLANQYRQQQEQQRTQQLHDAMLGPVARFR